MDGPRVYLKHRRTGRFYVELHEEISGRTWIEWTNDPRKATKFPGERRAKVMLRRLAVLGARCWRVRVLPGVIEGRDHYERDL